MSAVQVSAPGVLKLGTGPVHHHLHGAASTTSFQVSIYLDTAIVNHGTATGATGLGRGLSPGRLLDSV